jgi:transcriptional regulator with XRE-family HTH domain
MDGKLKWAQVVRQARSDARLTQRALAHLAGVPQPTVAEIESGRREPSLTLVSRLAEAAGFALKIEFVSLPRYSAIAVARRVQSVIENATGNEHVIDDAVLRELISFRDAIRKADPIEYRALVMDPPDYVGAQRWDAFLAAIVEDECAGRLVPAPRWTNDERRFTKPFWYLSEIPALHDWEFETAPAAFARHGVLVAVEELASV